MENGAARMVDSNKSINIKVIAILNDFNRFYVAHCC